MVVVVDNGGGVEVVVVERRGGKSRWVIGYFDHLFEGSKVISYFLFAKLTGKL